MQADPYADPELRCRTCTELLRTCSRCQTLCCACLACLCSTSGGPVESTAKKPGCKVAPPGRQPELMGFVGFPARLAWARRRCGLSLAELARTAGYSPHTLRSYERGQLRGGPPLKTVEDLARVLGVRRSWLAFGVGSVDRDLRTSGDDAQAAQ